VRIVVRCILSSIDCYNRLLFLLNLKRISNFLKKKKLLFI